MRTLFILLVNSIFKIHYKITSKVEAIKTLIMKVRNKYASNDRNVKPLICMVKPYPSTSFKTKIQSQPNIPYASFIKVKETRKKGKILNRF